MNPKSLSPKWSFKAVVFVVSLFVTAPSFAQSRNADGVDIELWANKKADKVAGLIDRYISTDVQLFKDLYKKDLILELGEIEIQCASSSYDGAKTLFAQNLARLSRERGLRVGLSASPEQYTYLSIVDEIALVFGIISPEEHRAELGAVGSRIYSASEAQKLAFELGKKAGEAYVGITHRPKLGLSEHDFITAILDFETLRYRSTIKNSEGIRWHLKNGYIIAGFDQMLIDSFQRGVENYAQIVPLFAFWERSDYTLTSLTARAQYCQLKLLRRELD